MRLEEYDTGGVDRWVFSSVDWEKFKQTSDKEMEKVDVSKDVDELNCSVCEAILGAAKQTIQRKGGK